MCHAIRWRGPDASRIVNLISGRWHLSLIHTRLSIIDLTTGGQPLSSVSGDQQIVFNGEIYNYRKLRHLAEQAGQGFRTQSDTEALLAHLQRLGTDGIQDLDGFFAFATWDGPKQRLMLARDRVGIKPLYYAPLASGGLAFASELKALLALPEVSVKISPQALGTYLFSDSIPAPYSLIEGVFKVPQGHFIEWNDGNLGLATDFWRPPEVITSVIDGADLYREARERLQEAVENSLIADVPVGILLSGGLDSSSVAVAAQKKTGAGIKTFSIGFDDPRFDESVFARMVAEQIGSEHIVAKCSEGEIIDRLPEILQRLDEPLADPSVLPTFLLCELASRHVKVVLGGDGGDELFGGYPTYRAHRYAQIYGGLPQWLRRGVLNKAIAALPVSQGYQPLEWKLKRFALNWEDDPIDRHRRWMASMDYPNLRQVLRANPLELPRRSLQSDGQDVLTRAMRYDFQNYLPDSVLTKVDRMSMSNGLEVRPPLLGNSFVDWVLSMPSSLKLHGGEGKYLLKRAMRGLLPNVIIDRPKRGFSVPLLAWQQGPLKPFLNKIFDSSPVWEWSILDREFYNKLWLEQQAGRANHSKPLWALMVLDQWGRSLS